MSGRRFRSTRMVSVHARRMRRRETGSLLVNGPADVELRRALMARRPQA